jgi:ATP-dependent exoDNAse (exonuclease V) alpha subunit
MSSSGQDVQFNIRGHPHVDYGYAATSHTSQGATADRVLVHVDTEQAHDQLVNSRLAYVSVSRGRFDAQKLREDLSRDVSKQSALESGHETGDRGQDNATESVEYQQVCESHGHGGGYGMEH